MIIESEVNENFNKKFKGVDHLFECLEKIITKDNFKNRYILSYVDELQNLKKTVSQHTLERETTLDYEVQVNGTPE